VRKEKHNCKVKLKDKNVYPGTVAFACNSSYLGDRDQEVCSLRPVQAKI
jgi:hypothetical protein